MYKFDGPNSVASRPAYGAPGTENWFGKGDPSASPPVPASNPDQDFFNMILAENLNLVALAGLARSKTDDAQIAQAVALLAGAKANTAITATATLTLAQQGRVFVNAAGGNVTLTLPAASALGSVSSPSGASTLPKVALSYRICRTDTSGNTVSIAAAGSDTVDGGSSIAVLPGDDFDVISDGVSVWRSRGTVSRRPTLNMTAGHYLLPFGLQLAWGTWSGTTGALSSGQAEGGVSLSFSRSFASAPLVFPSVNDVFGVAGEAVWNNGSTAGGVALQFRCLLATQAMTGAYFAVGPA